MALSDIASHLTGKFLSLPAQPNRLATEGFANRLKRSLDDILAPFPDTVWGGDRVIDALFNGIIAGVSHDLDYLDHLEADPDAYVLAGFIAVLIAETKRT